MRGMTLEKLVLPQSLRFFELQKIWRPLVSDTAYFLSLKARNSVNFIILGTGIFSHESVYVIIVFQYSIKRRTIFLRHPALNIKFYKKNYLRNYVRATLLNYEDDSTECKRP